MPEREGGWPKRTVKWWSVISAMPHCSLWSAADWEYALATAEVCAKFYEGGSASELRIRETVMGVTWDSRRDLRIRYVPAGPPAAEPEVAAADVTDIAEYR